MCCFCYWGWPEPIAKIYLRAVADLGGNVWPLHFGPAHIVWEDENFDWAERCLENFEKYSCDNSKEELTVVRWKLEELAKLPPEIRDIVPADYDGQHPERYPPSVEVIKV